MGINFVVAFLVTSLVRCGLGGKYGPCKFKCKNLGIGNCSRECRMERGDAILKSCWKACSVPALGSTDGAVLSECIRQCRVENCESHSKSTDFERVVDGLGSPESPVFTRDGNLYTTAYVAGQIRKIDLKNKKSSVLVSLSVDGFMGMPAGSQCDLENNIWVADVRLGLLKVKQDGTFQQIATKDNQGEVIQGCNDLTFDYRGNLWITAPYGPIAPNAFTESSKEAFGSVYCYNMSTGVLIKVATGFIYPNGIVVQHDKSGTPKKLIFGVTYNKNSPVWSYDITGSCQVRNKKVWGRLPAKSVVDGLALDEEGNLLVMEYESGFMYIFGPDGGRPICRISLPFVNATNLVFKPGSNELFITEHQFDSLWKINWYNKGMKQYCETV